MKATACRKSINDKTLSKLTYFIKTALSCVPFSWQSYELQSQSILVLQCLTHFAESSQVCQAILTDAGPEIIFDELKLAEASFY